jgi:hypothetical protein
MSIKGADESEGCPPGRRRRGTSPTQRSLRLIRERGWLVQVVETFNLFSNTRRDLFGFGDLVAIGSERIVIVQTTSGSNLSARRTKILTECRRAAEAWLRAGGLIELHGWRKLKGRWVPRVEILSLSDVATVLS